MGNSEKCQDFLSGICNEIRRQRIACGISQLSIASEINVNQSQYSKKERAIQEFTLSEIFAICEKMNLICIVSIKKREPHLPTCHQTQSNNENHRAFP